MLKSKKLIVLFIIVVLALLLIVKFERELVFISYLPNTIDKSISYKVNSYQVILPLQKFSFITFFDTVMVSQIRYFTFLETEEISNYYDLSRQQAENNYEIIKYDDLYLYYDKANNVYVQIPIEVHIYDNNIIRKVWFNLVPKDEIREIIEKKMLDEKKRWIKDRIHLADATPLDYNEFLKRRD